MKIKRYKQVWGLWMEYENVLQKYVFKFTRNKEETADIVQDILLKVHNSCCSNREIKNIRSWLFQIAHNTIMDQYKSKRKEDELTCDLIINNQDDIYAELSIYTNLLIGFLPEKYAMPLKMSDINGWKQQEIADELGLSLSATKSRIQRARVLLKEEILTCFHAKYCTNSGLIEYQLKQSCNSLKSISKK